MNFQNGFQTNIYIAIFISFKLTLKCLMSQRLDRNNSLRKLSEFYETYFCDDFFVT